MDNKESMDNKKSMDSSIMKPFIDEKGNEAHKMEFLYDSVENVVWKYRENADCQHFVPFSTMLESQFYME